METIKIELDLETTLTTDGTVIIEEVWAAMGRSSEPGGKHLVDLTDIPGVVDELTEAFGDRLRAEMIRRREHERAALTEIFKER